MDGDRFDTLTRLFARSRSRRRVLQATGMVTVAGFIPALRSAPAAAAPDGCCKCVGKATKCSNQANLRDCRTYCGASSDEGVVFSEKHECKKGGPGTTLQCRLKTTSLESDDAEALPCEGACPEGIGVSSPLIAAAVDLAARGGNGWALQEAVACFDGDACRAGGLFGAVPVAEGERVAAGVVAGYRQKSARRMITPTLLSDVREDLFFQFTQPSQVAEFEANVRDLVPAGLTDRTDDVQVNGVSFAYGFTGSTTEIADPAAETLALFAGSGNVAILSATTSTSGNAVTGYIDQEYKELIDSFAHAPLNLDLEILADSAVRLSGTVVQPEVQSAVNVFDGQSMPRDGEPTDFLDFRLLTDVGTIHALRTSFTMASLLGPVAIVHEVRELADEQAAIDFILASQGRLQTFFGPSLTTFTVTEFDNLGDQGTGFIYMRNLDEGGFNGGVTGYTRLGTLVGVTNVNIRTDSAPTPDQVSRVQDGRVFANPAVAILDRQLQIWLSSGTLRTLVVDEEPAFAGLAPTGGDGAE